MPKEQKLYQILEKANIETKIAVEIQDWILDTLDESKERSMFQFQEYKLLPLRNEMHSGFDSLRSEMNMKFERVDEEFVSLRSEMRMKFERVDEEFVSLRSELDLRFNLIDQKFALVEEKFDTLRSEMNTKFDSLIGSNRLLAIPIVGATIGGLGVVLLKILEQLQ